MYPFKYRTYAANCRGEVTPSGLVKNRLLLHDLLYEPICFRQLETICFKLKNLNLHPVCVPLYTLKYWLESLSSRLLAKLKEINDDQLFSVTVEWTGTFSIDEVLEMTGKEDCGVYRIYGHHIVFGKTALLYIGETVITPKI